MKILILQAVGFYGFTGKMLYGDKAEQVKTQLEAMGKDGFISLNGKGVNWQILEFDAADTVVNNTGGSFKEAAILKAIGLIK